MATFYEAQTLAEFVQLLKLEQGDSYAKLGEKTGAGKSTLHRVAESGAKVDDETIKKLADYANVPYPWLHDLAHPELRRPARFSKTTLLVADLIEQLPEDLQQIMLAQIRATVDNRRKQQTVKADK